MTTATNITCPECAEHWYEHGKTIPECCGTCSPKPTDCDPMEDPEVSPELLAAARMAISMFREEPA